ncbi:MAG: deacylase [Ignavibacteriae bacterium HGW-Ignavibacteriae-3]|nr:MAG: deacylase [Ignavibacteriae bacterium HGW-Ignavibacteriae-3]
MPANMLREFLDQNKVRFVTIRHSVAYTAQEIAASAHIKGKEMAKTVLIKIDGRMAMCVLPASNKIDFDLLKEALGGANIRLANEIEFKDKFPECDVGAMPPFGNLYDMDVYVDEALAKDEEIAFNACSHVELIQMAFKDYGRLVMPRLIKFSYHSKL